MVSTSPVPLARFEREDLLQIERALTREWLETDGRGGYASSTVLACNRRRYHGLLVAPYRGNPSRHVFLSRLEEWVHGPAGEGERGGGAAFPLSMARYSGVWSPHGHKLLERFELRPWPSFLYRIGGTEVLREVLMAKSRPAVLVRWSLAGEPLPLELRVRPLIAFRDAHHLTRENLDLDPRVERLDADALAIACRPYGSLPRLAISVDSAEASFEADPLWYRDVEYAMELERGLEGHEDLFSPGELRLPLSPSAPCTLAASLEEPAGDPAQLWERESATRLEALAQAGIGPRAQLALGADDFLYRAPLALAGPRVEPRERLGVIAGFPWFGEWGRDTFVSLPGLLLARGRVAECGDALGSVLGYLRGGLLPNVFGEARESSDYGSADASLWYARAVRAYDLAGGDRERLLERLAPALAEIAESYAAGTELGIAADQKGLIRAGAPSSNATWMDARTSLGPVTPRDGYAVELNALWYFLLAYLEDLARRAGDGEREREWRKRKRLAGRSFLRRFWLEDGRYLADVWKEGAVDRSVRPNMVIAASLEFSPLSRGKRTDVVKRAELELLTPRGLRSLAPSAAGYRGAYRGGPQQRDGAYHQGTVWPWLIGPFCEAYLRAYGSARHRLQRLRELLAGLDDVLSTQGLNHVSEVFDGDPPHRPGGSIAQAWNTAELLRAWQLIEELEA
ncbi:MAG TPA: amylo-alpha-1,6-glucosidase [Planctomycetota bacterium]|nr:amylo-alpha-1,6-glucosidase [Planctomycetota bacterium]